LLHARHDFIEDLIKVFVNLALVIAQLLALLEEVLAQQVFLFNNNFLGSRRIRIIRKSVLIHFFLDAAVFVHRPRLALVHRLQGHLGRRVLSLFYSLGLQKMVLIRTVVV
jgi:hypothetical protein